VGDSDHLFLQTQVVRNEEECAASPYEHFAEVVEEDEIVDHHVLEDEAQGDERLDERGDGHYKGSSPVHICFHL